MSKEILIIDDNTDIRNIINDLIIDAGYKTRLAANYNQALNEIDKKLPDVAIIDVKLDKGDNDGLELLTHIKNKDKNIPVIIITGHANIEMAIKALKTGAFEFIEKPFNQERLLNFVNRAVENINLKNINKEFEDKLFYSYDIIGDSENIINIKDQINKISLSESRIFINGPTGSGKELVARKIHKNSSRSKEPFIIINAALLKEKNYEKELFGEEFDDGTISFGALERANRGTLLIDEVSEIPFETQANVLRVLIDQKFKRLNGSKDINVNIRLISSTSQDLNQLVKNNKFREDLFHRLNVMPIELTSLTTRTEDIPLLINYFKNKLFEINGVSPVDIDIKNDSLYTYSWPGNVRELRNLIERITILSSNESKDDINKVIDDILTPSSKLIEDKNILEQSFQSPLKEARENFEKEYLSTQLKKHHGNISKTADFIGMERSALHRKLKSLGIKGIN